MGYGALKNAVGGSHYVAFALQTAWNTPAASGFVYMPAHQGSGKKTQGKAFSKQLEGGERKHGRNNNKTADISIPFDYREEGIEQPLITMFAVASTIINGWKIILDGNDTIDFQDDGVGANIVATIAPGDYNVATFGPAVKAALDGSASAKTFTVTYSAVTRKWTLVPSAGTVKYNFLSGPNQAKTAALEFGFKKADTLDAGTHTGDYPAGENYRHDFTYPEGNDFPVVGALVSEFGCTILDHKDLQTFQLLSMFGTAVSWVFGENDPFCIATMTFQGCDRIPVEPGVYTPAYGLVKPATPDGRLSITATVEKGANIEVIAAEANSLSLNVSSVPTAMKHSITSTTAKTAVRTGQLIYEGSWAWPYNNATNLYKKWTKSWDEDTYGELKVELLGDYIRTPLATTPRRKTTWNFREIAIKGDDPSVGSSGTFDQPFSFDGQYDTTDGQPGFLLSIENTIKIY